MSAPDTATLRRLAVESDADPRSVRKEYLRPGSVRGLAGHRIREVLRKNGLQPGIVGAPAVLSSAGKAIA